MNRKQTKAVNLSEVRKKLILSLAINGLIPLVLYVLVRPSVANDVVALALVGAIPAIRTLYLWIKRRKVDWIGVLAIVGYSLALGISAFSGGNSLLLKVHEQLITGTIGLVLLISALIHKPLLRPLLLAVRGSDFEFSGSPTARKRINFVTAALGLVLLGNAAAHIILALALPAAAFLALSRLVTWVTLGSGAAILWLTRQSVGSRTD